MHTRENALSEWVKTIYPNIPHTIKPLTGDASFRRYFRLYLPNHTQVIMDAPPEKETLLPFITVSKKLTDGGIAIPMIHHVEPTQGFALLDDFGNTLLLQALSQGNVDELYRLAMTTLTKIQQCAITNPSLPAFDKAFMLTEVSYFHDWFLQGYLELSLSPQETRLLNNALDWLTDAIASQPQTFIHRDYHSRNIMLLSPKETHHTTPLGIIDFQDAMVGPITYDLVSLLKDCYIQWPRERILSWVQFFYEQIAYTHSYSYSEFCQAFDLMGIQRHLKVLGIFSRLHLRDKKSAYLRDLPLTLNYVLSAMNEVEELQPLRAFMLKRCHLKELGVIE